MRLSGIFCDLSEATSCDLFTFLAGCTGLSTSDEADIELFEAEEDLCDRDALGKWMPNEGSDSDFRRVLYGMLGEAMKRMDSVQLGTGWDRMGWDGRGRGELGLITG